LTPANEMHMANLATSRLCSGKSYWAQVGFTTPSNNEQDPIKMASFYKGSSN